MKYPIYVMLIIGVTATMGRASTLYWYGGTGNWSDYTNHWSNNSGNSPASGASAAPTSSDTVVFDSSSDSGSDYVVTINATATCDTMTWDTQDVTPTLAGTYGLTVSGNLTLVSSLTVTHTGGITFDKSGTQTLTSAGKAFLGNIIVKAGTTLQLVDALTFSGNGKLLSVSDFGVLDTNGQTVTINIGTSGGTTLSGNFISSSEFDTLVINGANSVTGQALQLGGNVAVSGDLTLAGYDATKRLLICSYPAGSGSRGLMVGGSVIASNVDFHQIKMATYTTPKVIVQLGDSLTVGMGAAPLNNLVVNQSGGDYCVVNKGIHGNTTSQMAARFATDVAAVTGVEYVVVAGGTNDIGVETTSTIESNLQSIYDAAATAGITVIACTIPPAEDRAGWTTEKQSDQDTVNAWIIAGPTHVDYVVDAYSLLEDPDDPDGILPGWDFDHVHLQTPGYVAWATAIYDEVPWPAAGTSSLLDLSAITGLSGDCGGNGRITFTTPITCYWVHPATMMGYWGSTENWRTASGGLVQARVPLPQDTARFDAASIDTTGRIVRANVGRIGKDVNFTGITNNPTIDLQGSMYGSLTLAPVADWTNYGTTSVLYFKGVGDFTLTSAGFAFTQPIWLNCTDATLSIADELAMSSGVTCRAQYGTINIKSKVMEVTETTKYTVVNGLLNLANCTFWRASSGSTLISQTGGEVIMSNCIARNVADVYSGTVGKHTMTSNCYYGSSDEGGTGSITSDPKLAAEFTNFRLQACSPCIGAGTDLGSGADYLDPDGINQDNYGDWEMGAYVYNLSLFGDDSTCKALYTFEDGALTVDSTGNGNTLTPSGGAVANTTYFEEGFASCDFEADTPDYMYRADADLAAGFPTKNGGTKDFTVCIWIRPESVPGTSGAAVICGKYAYTAGDYRSWAVRLWGTTSSNTNVQLRLSSDGTSANTTSVTHASDVDAAEWTHISVSYDDDATGTASAYRIHLSDGSSTIGTDVTGTWANTLYLTASARWEIGSYDDGSGSVAYDGLIDELVVFDRVLSVAEMNQVAAGTYGSLSGSGPRYYYRMMLQ